MRKASARLVLPLVALVALTAFLSFATASGRAGTRTLNPPTISSFSPTSGAVGKLVTITGTHFKGVSAVRFGKAYSMFTVVSSTTIQANVPPGALTGLIKVTKGMQTVSSADPLPSSQDHELLARERRRRDAREDQGHDLRRDDRDLFRIGRRGSQFSGDLGQLDQR